MRWIKKLLGSNSKSGQADYKLPDNSPEISTPEIEALILNAAEKYLSGFKIHKRKKGCILFLSENFVHDRPIYQTFTIYYPSKGIYIDCSVASRLNPLYIESGQYNSGLINPCKDLLTLNTGKTSSLIEDSYCFGTIKRQATTSKAIEDIFSDFLQFGVPFLEKQIRRIENHALILGGLEYIKSLETNGTNLSQQIEAELSQVEYLISRLKNPTYVRLKEYLQSINGQSREDRKLIPKLAYELLELPREE